MKTLSVHVPSGIGDILWIHSKLRNIPGVKSKEVFLHYLIDDGIPQRSAPFISVLDPSCTCAYSSKKYRDIVVDCAREVAVRIPTSSIEFNTRLEQGIRIEKILPALPFDVEGVFATSQYSSSALQLLGDISSRKLIGIYPSSYKPIQAWGAWSISEWLYFIEVMLKDYSDVVPVIIGAEFDRSFTATLVAELRAKNIQFVDLTGSHIGVTIECIRKMHQVIGFASGIEIISNYLKIPTVMIYPEKLDKLRGAWNLPGVSYCAPMWSYGFDRIYSSFAKMM